MDDTVSLVSIIKHFLLDLLISGDFILWFAVATASQQTKHGKQEVSAVMKYFWLHKRLLCYWYKGDIRGVCSCIFNIYKVVRWKIIMWRLTATLRLKRLTYSLLHFETTAHLWHLRFLCAVYKFTHFLTYVKTRTAADDQQLLLTKKLLQS